MQSRISRYFFASAFRNGSGSVTTAISTLHSKFQWEGVVLNHREFERLQQGMLCTIAIVLSLFSSLTFT